MDSKADASLLITASGLSKSYRVWKSPTARLQAPIYRKFHSWIGRPASQNSDRFYSDFTALKSVDLSLRKGDCLGIVGRNGSGKSTLLKILSGILRPSSGTVRVHGKVAALLELGTGFSEDFTGRENVYLNAAIHGISRGEIDAKFASIEDFAGIGAFIDQKVRTYSSGMVVRLAFSVLVHLEPDILIIDEALAVGDGAFVQKCMRWIKHFVSNHTAIFVSHDMSAITQFCNRAIWMEAGEIAYSGTPKATTEKYFEVLYERTNAAPSETSAAADVEPQETNPNLIIHQETGSPSMESVNTLQFFKFDPTTPSFGEYRAQITDVRLSDSKGRTLGRIQGGEIVTVTVTAAAMEAIESPIIGFGVKNRQGQELFHENTALSSMRSHSRPMNIPAGGEIEATFTFRMPYFPSGDYFVFAAIATGNHQEHIQQHWIHEAVRFVATPNRVALGLIGLPMMQVTLDSKESKIESPK